MSAIVIRNAPSSSSETTPLLSNGPGNQNPRDNKVPHAREATDQSSHSHYSATGDRSSRQLPRVAPLKESISTSRFVLICVGIWSANFVFAFQGTAIPTLAPEVSSAFGRAELAAYLGSIFSLASAAVIPIYGVLMDTLGRGFAMDTACFFFGFGAVFCALSENIWTLIAARAFAGLGGGGMLTVSSVIVTDLVPLRDRGLYQGIMMSIFGAGSMIGGPLSGWITDTYGWQWAFWIQIPMVLFCVVIVTCFLPPAPIAPTHSTLAAGLKSLDWMGSFLLLVGVTTLILGFSFHTSFLLPWAHPMVYLSLATSVLCLSSFFGVEKRVKNPLVPISLLRSKHRLAILASGFFLSVGNQAFMFIIPMYFNVICNTSTAQAGLPLSLCGGLGLALGSLFAGQHIRRGGRYRLLGILSLLPAIAASFIATAWTPNWPWWGYYLTFFPASLGYSIFLCCQLIALISAVDSKSMPKATALLYTVRTLGVALGVSIGGSIQIGALAGNLKRAFADNPNRDKLVQAVLHSKSVIRQLPSPLSEQALEAYAGSIKTVWAVSGVVAVVTVICAWGIQEKNTEGKVAEE